jgi:transcriptional regulator
VYIPPAFKEEDLGRQHEFIRTNPLGLLISSDAEGLQASALPFHLDANAESPGRLQGHLAKANRHLQVLDGQQVLVVFQGPDAYVTPSWYAAKAEHGKVVPTWNYVMVQVRGIARTIDDAQWLRDHVTRLTRTHEESQSQPWAVSDAPPAFIDALLSGIVGIEVEIQGIEGKWKVSQNRSAEDREGVVTGLVSKGDVTMADLVKRATDR